MKLNYTKSTHVRFIEQVHTYVLSNKYTRRFYQTLNNTIERSRRSLTVKHNLSPRDAGPSQWYT